MSRITTLLAIRTAATLVAVGVLAVGVLGGCAASPVAQPSTSPAAAAGSAGSATAGATASAGAPSATASAASANPGAVTTTDIPDWGRIWDALPPSFPRYPGATATQATVPATAVLIVPTDVQTAAAWLKAAFDAGEWATIVGGPLEDGSMALDSVGPADNCQVSTRIAKVGSTTQMTILYAAACPFQ